MLTNALRGDGGLTLYHRDGRTLIAGHSGNVVRFWNADVGSVHAHICRYRGTAVSQSDQAAYLAPEREACRA